MAINSQLLTSGLLLSNATTAVDQAYYREHHLLYQLYAIMEPIAVGQDTAEVTVSEEAVDIVDVAFERTLLDRGTEAVLDAIDANWRAADSDVPRHYLWKGEQQLRKLRLHPANAAAGELQIIESVEPPIAVAQWHNAFVALLMMRRLALADTVNAREPLVELMTEVINLIIQQFGVQVNREARLL